MRHDNKLACKRWGALMSQCGSTGQGCNIQKKSAEAITKQRLISPIGEAAGPQQQDASAAHLIGRQGRGKTEANQVTASQRRLTVIAALALMNTTVLNQVLRALQATLCAML